LKKYVKKIGLIANFDRFAYDFMVADLSGKVHKRDGSRLEDFYGWGKPVLIPGDGKVVSAMHDKADNPVSMSLPPIAPEQYERLRKEAFENLGSVGFEGLQGNHVIIDHGNSEFSLIDHMQKDSVKVEVGDQVTRGTVLGNIGNSGDSRAPHIHYGMQNGMDCRKSEGLPSRFNEFDLLLGNIVKRIQNLCPNTGMIVKH
jgi:murein DD-endopeptidase MepM/ murein hydrolase activator NlpD